MSYKILIASPFKGSELPPSIFVDFDEQGKLNNAYQASTYQHESSAGYLGGSEGIFPSGIRTQ